MMGAGCGVRGAGCGVMGAGCGMRGARCEVRGARCVFRGGDWNDLRMGLFVRYCGLCGNDDCGLLNFYMWVFRFATHEL